MNRSSAITRVLIVITITLILVFSMLIVYVGIFMPKIYTKNNINEKVEAIASIDTKYDNTTPNNYLQNSFKKWGFQTLALTATLNSNQFINSYLIGLEDEDRLLPRIYVIAPYLEIMNEGLYVDYAPGMLMDISGYKISGQSFIFPHSLTLRTEKKSYILIDGNDSKKELISSVYRNIEYKTLLNYKNAKIVTVDKCMENADTSQNFNMILDSIAGRGEFYSISEKGFYVLVESESYTKIVLHYFATINFTSYIFCAIGNLEMLNLPNLNITSYILVAFVVALLILLITCFLVSHHMQRPLREILKATEELSVLNFNVELKEHTGFSEIDMITKSINMLASYLNISLKQIINQNIELNDNMTKNKKNEEHRYLFLRTLLHESKTPLAIIQANMLLIEKADTLSESEKAKQIESVYKQIDALNELLINTLNLYLKDELSLQSDFTQFNIDELICEVISKFTPLLTNKNIKINKQVDSAKIFASKNKIEMVLNNLLLNAINYSNKGAVFVINGSANPINYDISITNNNLNHIKAKNSNGMGQKIVKGILELHECEHKIIETDDSYCYSFSLSYN